MSKPVKDMIIAEYRKRFTGVSGGVVVELRGLEATANNRIRTNLQKKGVRITVLKNSLARKAFEGGPLDPLAPSLAGPSALIYGDRSVVDVARDVVAIAAETKELELKAAVLDGQYFAGRAGVEALSKFPTREEAQAKLVLIALSPAKKLAGAAIGPGSKILAIVKEIQNRLEKGETIAAMQ